jgi:membrane associated rhomboid family serine protease
MTLSMTLILIAITCAVSLVAMKNEKMIEALILWPPAIDRRKEWYRLVSYGLIHADFMHLLFNMVTLFFFGRVMEGFYEDALGPFGFAIFYLVALVASILPTYLRHRHDTKYYSLGASGAVSAVLFAFILFQPWQMIYIFVLPVPAILYAVAYVVYSIWADRQGGDRINHSAHLWGAAVGVAFTVLLEPAVVPHFLGQLARPFGG